MTDKPEWWKPENEKEPGHPLSRVPELWQGLTSLGVSPLEFASLLSGRIRELLAVIDRLDEELIHEQGCTEFYKGVSLDKYRTIHELHAQLAAAEKLAEELQAKIDEARDHWLEMSEREP